MKAIPFFLSYSDVPPICQGNYVRGQIVIRFFCSTECLSLLFFPCRYFLYCVICIATLIEYLMFPNERTYCAGILENDSFRCVEVEWKPNFYHLSMWSYFLCGDLLVGSLPWKRLQRYVLLSCFVFVSQLCRDWIRARWRSDPRKIKKFKFLQLPDQTSESHQGKSDF